MSGSACDTARRPSRSSRCAVRPLRKGSAGGDAVGDTWSAHRAGAVRVWLAALVLGCGMAPTTPVGAQAKGRVHCEILENGKPAAGTFRLIKQGTKVAEGSCRKPLDVPAGEYEAVLSLDGALDGPEQRKQVRVKPSEETGVRAKFATGTLVVRIKSEGRNAAGMVTIRKNGRTVATLASGVDGHLSAGTYDLEARYRTQKQQLRGVRLSAGGRRELTVSFD